MGRNFVQGYTKDDPDAERVAADKIYCNTAVQPGGGKLAVNFEGTVASVEETRITLENGQVILVTDDTVFSAPSRRIFKAVSPMTSCWSTGTESCASSTSSWTGIAR